MKTYIRLLVPSVLLAGYASAATISLSGVSPFLNNTDSATSTLIGASSNGTFSTLTASTIPVQTTVNSALNAGSYVVRVSGITVGADTNLSLVFNLDVAASLGDGIAIRKGNSASNRGWVVDDNQNGGTEAIMLGAGESITFSISGMSVTGGIDSYDVAFNGFTGGVFSPDGGTGSFAPGMTGIMTGTGGYARGLDFNFDITAVPEPSCLTLGAMGAALLLRRRRH